MTPLHSASTGRAALGPCRAARVPAAVAPNPAPTRIVPEAPARQLEPTSATWCTLLDDSSPHSAPAADYPQDRSQGSPSTSTPSTPTPSSHHSSHRSVSMSAWLMLLDQQQAAGKRPRRTLRSMTRPPNARQRKKTSSEEVALHRQAMASAKAGKTRNAIRMLVDGLHHYPHNVFFPHSAAVLLAKSKQHDSARNYFNLALRIDPSSTMTLQAWALLEARVGNTDKARDLFQQATEADQTHAPAWQAWGRFEADQGDARAARRLFNTSLQHQPHHEPTLNALAKLEMASSNWAAAQALLRRAIESNPTHAQSWTALGEVCYRLGDLDQARQMFECLARYCGPDSIAYTTWANVELHAGELGKGRTLLERAIHLDKSNTHAWLLLACAHARAANFNDALKIYRSALLLHPTNRYLQYAYSQFLIDIGKPDEARSLLLRLQELDPGNGRITYSLGMVALQEGELQEAAQLFKRGLKDSQPDTALLNYEELANLATGQGRPEIARDLYSRACQLYAPTSRFLRMWGLFEKRQGNVERARSLFRESLDCDAMDIKTWTMWGVLERTQGDHETALHMFREGVAVSPKNDHLWYLICDTAARCSSLEDCRSTFAEANANAARSAQLATLEALMEWRNENPARARTIFQEGSTFTTAGKPEFYGPLYEAWIQFEEAQGEKDNAKAVSADYAQLLAKDEELEGQSAARRNAFKPSDKSVSRASQAVLEALK